MDSYRVKIEVIRDVGYSGYHKRIKQRYFYRNSTLLIKRFKGASQQDENSEAKNPAELENDSNRNLKAEEEVIMAIKKDSECPQKFKQSNKKVLENILTLHMVPKANQQIWQFE